MVSIMKLTRKTQNILSALLLLAIWQAAAMLLNQTVLLASPVQVLGRLCTIWRDRDFFSAIRFSFVRIVGGFLLGLVLGTLLAVLAGRFPVLEVLFRPFFATVKSVPVASFIVISLIWLSSSQLSVFISFLMVLPVIYNNMLTGIHSMDVKLEEAAELFRVSPGKKLLYIELPQIKPFLLSACNTGLGFAWKSGVAAEIIGIPDGSIGEMLYNAKAYLNTVDLFAWTVIIVAVSILFEKLFLALIEFLFRRLEAR